MDKFYDRQEAGILLANQLKKKKLSSNSIVLALPRGGVPVGFEIAKALSIPLDIMVVRKIGVPGREELAMGAIAMNGFTFLNKKLIKQLDISDQAIDDVIQRESKELARRAIAYRRNQPYPILTRKTIILVDDGIATGASIRAAVYALRELKPNNIIIASPVIPISTYEELFSIADEWVCLLKPKFFDTVGQWYEHFDQTTDDEVTDLLSRTNQRL